MGYGRSRTVRTVLLPPHLCSFRVPCILSLYISLYVCKSDMIYVHGTYLLHKQLVQNGGFSFTVCSYFNSPHERKFKKRNTKRHPLKGLACRVAGVGGIRWHTVFRIRAREPAGNSAARFSLGVSPVLGIMCRVLLVSVIVCAFALFILINGRALVVYFF
jgi:hypothetical protein